jgi:hypothetical protein
MFQLTGAQISALYFSTIKLIESGMSVSDAHASMGILPNTRLHDLMSGDIQSFVDFPESKVTILM